MPITLSRRPVAAASEPIGIDDVLRRGQLARQRRVRPPEISLHRQSLDHGLDHQVAGTRSSTGAIRPSTLVRIGSPFSASLAARRRIVSSALSVAPARRRAANTRQPAAAATARCRRPSGRPTTRTCSNSTPRQANVTAVTDLWYDDDRRGAAPRPPARGVVDSRSGSRSCLLAERHRVILYDQRASGARRGRTGPTHSSRTWSRFSRRPAWKGGAGRRLPGRKHRARRGGRAARARPRADPARLRPAGRAARRRVAPDDRALGAGRGRRRLAGHGRARYGGLAPMGADPTTAMFSRDAVWFEQRGPGHRRARRRARERHNRSHSGDHGGRDVRGINEIGDRLARDIPDARSAVIQEADHMIPGGA